MKDQPVRKFKDLATGRVSEPQESVVVKAFREIRNTPQGHVIEQYFLHLLTLTPDVDAPDSAFRENAAARRIASRIVRWMNEEARDGNGSSPSASPSGKPAGGLKRTRSRKVGSGTGG